MERIRGYAKCSSTLTRRLTDRFIIWRGRISSLMGEVAKGIKSFRSGMKEGENALQDDASDVIDVDKTNSGSDEKSDK